MDAKRLAEALKNLDAQSFRPGDSLLASTINHPIDAMGEFGNWLAGRVNTAAGIPDQYDNPNPLLAPQGQEQAAFDIAGMAQLGSMPFAPKSAGGTLGTFIGPKAATWDADAAAAATKMLDDGIDPAQVWKEHLIGRMPDKSLFSEIDDSVSFMKPSSEWGWGNREGFKQGERAIGSLDEFMSHQGIADNYPGFFDFGDDGRRMVMTIDKNAGDGGSFGDSSIRLGANTGDDGSSIANKSTALHELQHAIQQREGWARGGSPEQFKNIKSLHGELLRQKNEVLNDYGFDDWANNLIINNPDKYNDLLLSGKDTLSLEPMYKEFSKTLADDDARYVLYKLGDYDNQISEYEKLARYDPQEAYYRLTGEAQARATQDRLNMDMQQRRENYPLAGGKLSDIPLEQLIYRYGDNGPSMSVNRGDYVGEHMAPLKDSGAPLHNLTANDNAIYPDDVYSARANDYYGTGEPEDAEIFRMARYLKDKPLEKVSMYRAIPDPNYDISKQVKELEKIGVYKNKFGFFPNNNSIVDELYSKHNVDGVSYDQAQKNMLDEVYARIAELDSKKQKTPGINHGDWVALDRKYAKEHGESALNGKYKIVSKKAPAKQLFTNGDSIREWGWDSTAARLLPATMLGYGMANQDKNPLAEALRNGN